MFQLKNALFEVYCSSHYGSDSWDLTHRTIKDYCVAWRKELCNIWKLSSLNVAVVSNTVPIYDEPCQWIMNFIHSCLHCDSKFVQLIVRNSISAGMNSMIGWNVAHCSAHFNLSIRCACDNCMNTQLVARANISPEVLKIRDGLLEFSSDLLEYSELNDLLSH